jgi:hypothetical protein
MHMDKHHGKAAIDMQHGDMDMEHGHEVWTCGIACRLDMQNRHA